MKEYEDFIDHLQYMFNKIAKFNNDIDKFLDIYSKVSKDSKRGALAKAIIKQLPIYKTQLSKSFTKLDVTDIENDLMSVIKNCSYISNHKCK